MSSASVIDKFPIRVLQLNIARARWAIGFCCTVDGKDIGIALDTDVRAAPSPNISDIDFAWHRSLLEDQPFWKNQNDIPGELCEVLTTMADQYFSKISGDSLTWKFLHDDQYPSASGWYLKRTQS
ncbi:MAG: hypothetical protein AAB628_00950 [Patescibacteria group bacterium]